MGIIKRGEWTVLGRSERISTHHLTVLEVQVWLGRDKVILSCRTIPRIHRPFHINSCAMETLTGSVHLHSIHISVAQSPD